MGTQNDYHYSLIYDILEDFCAVRNDTARDFEMPIVTIGELKIWEVDFEVISEIYFPDTDFLMPRERMEALGEEEKERFGFRRETFSIAMGFKPHPEELKLKPVEKGKFIPQPSSDCVYSKSVSKHPEPFHEES